ncbi:MAG: hypothetical protein CM15mV23_0510 [Eurybiavirus sp.]|nr:MAG: hypothetical protein CM15mV23_0510 [Eurybiavirus sp.]
MNLWKNWKEAVWETFPDLEYQKHGQSGKERH